MAGRFCSRPDQFGISDPPQIPRKTSFTHGYHRPIGVIFIAVWHIIRSAETHRPALTRLVCVTKMGTAADDGRTETKGAAYFAARRLY